MHKYISKLFIKISLINKFLPWLVNHERIFRWIYWIGLAVIFGLGVGVRFAIPTLPIMDADTESYLLPAIGVLTEGTYIPTFRNFLYPCLVLFVLQVLPYFGSILFIQHIFGLIAAVVIFLIFIRSRIFLPSGKSFDWSVRIVAMIAVAGFLFSKIALIMEHSIRPEALFPTTCAITILAGVEISRRLLFKKFDGQMIAWAVILIFFSVGNFCLKPSWGFAIGTSLIPLFLACFWIPGKWLWKSGVLLLGILLVCVAFIFPESFFQNKLGARKHWFLPGTLLAAHADILYDVLEKDALRMPSDSKERASILAFLERTSWAMQHPTLVRYGLNINPDNLLYGPGIEKLWEEFKDPVDFSRFCYSYYFRGWIEHPLAMFSKVVKQMYFFYSFKEKNVYSAYNYLPLKKLYRYSLNHLHHEWSQPLPSWSPLNYYYKDLQTLDIPEEAPLFCAPVSYFLKMPLRWIGYWVNYTFLPFFIISAFGAILVLLSGNRFVELRPAAALLLYFSSFNFANSLTISVIHMMDVERYYFGQVTMTLVSQGFEFLFLFALLSACFQYLEQKKMLHNPWAVPQVVEIPPNSGNY